MEKYDLRQIIREAQEDDQLDKAEKRALESHEVEQLMTKERKVFSDGKNTSREMR